MKQTQTFLAAAIFACSCYSLYLNFRINKLERSQKDIAYGLVAVIDFIIEDNSQKSPFTQPRWYTPEHDELLQAIQQVETGNGVLVGDNGQSIGPYQIQLNYWLDAVEHKPELKGEYTDVFGEEYAKMVVVAYWDRYGKKINYLLEGLARIHNGGPNGYRKESTQQYWQKVNKILLESK